MSIQSRRASAIHLLNSSARFGAHEIRRDAAKQRGAAFDFNPIRVFRQLARKSGQFVLELIGRREVMIDLDQEQADYSRNVVNVNFAIGDVFRVIKIDHLDGPIFRLERKAYAPSARKWSRA